MMREDSEAVLSGACFIVILGVALFLGFLIWSYINGNATIACKKQGYQWFDQWGGCYNKDYQVNEIHE